MKNFKRNAVILSAALALAATSVSQAVPTIRISDGINTVTVTDGGAGDGEPGSFARLTAGFVNYTAPAGTFAGWSVILSAGTTKPLLGSTIDPQLDLAWSITREAGAGQGMLTVLFSENGFNVTGPGIGTALTASGGTLGQSAGNSAQVRTYYAGNDIELSQTLLLTSQTFTGPDPIDQVSSGPLFPDPSVAFTLRLDLTQQAGEITSGDIHMYTLAPTTTIDTPEGGSMVTLLGTALLALGAFAARRKA